mmetsp:Transcript_32063/g.64782  ORF Transcript_32063/g.64782 Transcript_32063/m.64782 type:complete len:416 (+) Transcript_32063:74-1321(+)
MKTATHLLCTVAAVVTSSHHRCSAYVTAPSSFGIKSYATRAIRGKKEYSTIGTSRASTCMYSVPYLPSMEEEGDDGSFFLSASQQAANERYELLKQGKDPLAVSLSTAPAQEESQEQQQQQDTAEKEEVTAAVNESDSIDDNTGVESLPTLQTDDYDDLLSSLSESPMAQSLEEEEKEDNTAATQLEEGSSTSSTLDEIKRVEDEIAAVKSQIKYKFQKRLMDTRMQFDDAERVGEGSTAEEMEAARNARLAAADQVKQVLVSGEELEEEEAAVSVPTSTDSTSTVDAGEGSTAEEMEEARKARLAEADEIAKTLKNIEPTAVTAPTTSTVQVEEEVEEETIEPVVETSPAASKIEEEPSNANQSKLSSDGKVIYEPSQAALDINQENVDNGLMVLTRSFLVLNSIVQRLDEDKK